MALFTRSKKTLTSPLAFFALFSLASFSLMTSAAAQSTPTDPSSLRCPRYKVYYIDPAAQFFTPPVPLEDHAEFVFCSDHANLDEVRVKLKKLKPIRSHPDLDTARIKVIPNGKPTEAIVFCSTGEITYRGKQYRLDRRSYEPSLLAIREEGDRQRDLAIEREAELDPRNPASERVQKPKK